MLQAIFRPGLALAPVLFFATPAFGGFTLPDHSRIAVTAFAVPAVSEADEAERDFSRILHDRMVFALQKAGFTVVPQRESGAGGALVKRTPAAPSAAAKPGAETAATAGETPETQESSPAADAPGSAAGQSAATADGATADAATEAPVREGEVGDSILAGPDAAQKNGPVESAALEAEEKLAGVFARPETEEDAKNATSLRAAEPATEGGASAKAEPEGVSPMGPEYILRGRVTLLRERVGSPARIGGDIRIRTESMLHCAYTVEDALTGYVLVSDVASGSSARVVGPANDIDAALHDLTDKVMASAAHLIASRLSGMDTAPAAKGGDREEYQDSPGKRLKSGNAK